MAYRRCECSVGGIPHPTEASHKRKHSRCTRAVTMEIRRVRDTTGRKCDAGWYAFCRPCGLAIMAYQGSDVEMRPFLQTAIGA
jgi:hypothetical protein